jgi:hypothetical protein
MQTMSNQELIAKDLDLILKIRELDVNLIADYPKGATFTVHFNNGECNEISRDDGVPLKASIETARKVLQVLACCYRTEGRWDLDICIHPSSKTMGGSVEIGVDMLDT